MRSFSQRMATLAVNTLQSVKGRKIYRRVLREFDNPMAVQRDFLLRLVADNKDTEYGRKYHFDEIHSVEDFKRLVPVTGWEDYKDYVERMKQAEENVLTAYPCRHFNLTSGTSGTPKNIPYTDRQQDMFLKYNSLYIQGLLREKLGAGWCKGRCFCPMTFGCETLENGITVGHAAAKMTETMGAEKADKMLRTLYTTPLEGMANVPGTDLNYIQCRFFLEAEDVTGIIVPYYSQLVAFLHYLRKNYALLIDDIEKGTIDPSVELPAETRESLLKKISPNPKRAAALRAVFADGADFPFIPKVWPNMRYLVGVGGDGLSVYDRMIKEYYSGDTLANFYSGITSTEGLYSITCAVNETGAALAPGGAFMEFLPVEEEDTSKTVTMDRLEVGRRYELIVTNLAGFYRYRLSDSVLVTGKIRNTPRVEFAYRTNKTVNMCSEKITEETLETIVREATDELGIELYDFNLYLDYENMGYDFLVEPVREYPSIHADELSAALERALRRNNDVYPAQIDMGARKAPVGHFLQVETNLLYRDKLAMQGVNTTTLKPLHILSKPEDERFFRFMIEHSFDS